MQSVKIESKEMPTHNKIKFSLKIANGYTLNWMTPQEYIERVNIRNKLTDDEISKKTAIAQANGLKGILHHPPFSEESISSLKEAISKGVEIDMPTLEYENGKIVAQEGFHRVLIAEKIGISYSKDHYIKHNLMIPVGVKGHMPYDFKTSTFKPEEQIPSIHNIKNIN